jgi:ribonuclease R
MKDIQKQILDFFGKYPSQSFKSKELARRLRMTEEKSYSLLRSALHDLFESQKIRREKGKRYGFKAPEESLQTGTLYITRQGYGYVELDSGEGVFIGPKNLGTALDEDRVRIILFARPARKRQAEDIELEGEVVDVVQRSRNEIVGVLKRTKNFYFVEPDDRSVRRDIYIPKASLAGAQDGYKVVAVIEEWEDPLLNPEGKVIEVLGKSGELSVELRSIALRYEIPITFPKETLREAEVYTDAIPETEYARRRDMRSVEVVTIDPKDAKDFDDALSLEDAGDGNVRLGVHIADVSYYVREATALDREAYKRGTSVYLVDGVIPMLPERLSNNLCSLRPDEDRLAYSVFMTVTPRGTVSDYSVEETVIRSTKRFTYEDAQRIIEEEDGELAGLILGLHKLARTLLKKRLREGSIDFETSEVTFKLDKEGKPVDIIKKVRLDAHRLVEECMLLANKTIARHIGSGLNGKSKKRGKNRPDDMRPFIYRIHASPERDKLRELAAFVSQFGYTLQIDGSGVSKSLQKLLNAVKGSDEENIINEVTLRSMMKAVYSDKNTGHFGLGFKHYTHFTSPIRRYPDLLVHRLLKEYESGMPSERRQQLRSRMPGIGETTSAREQRAVAAERESVKVMQVEYMKRHIGDEFDGIISGVINAGIFVELTDTLVEGMVHVRNMENDYFTFDSRSYTMVGRSTGRQLRLGDKIRVKVLSVDPERTEIDFILCD